MIAKNTMEYVVSQQWKLAEEAPAGFQREVTSSLPYLAGKALLLGGMRGSGCSTLLLQMLHGDYIKAWYTDFEDPRLAGFDNTDFIKLGHLIVESGRGVLLLDRVDLAPGWQDFIASMTGRGIKVVAAVSLAAFAAVEASDPGLYELCRVRPLSYGEFLEASRKRPSESSVAEYIRGGAFPSQARGGRESELRELYDNIIMRDVILPGGVRDRAALQRIALKLNESCGQTVSANAMRGQLKIKAVSTVTEHFELLSSAGLFTFVPIYSENPARQAVNPRKVYPSDTAMASALATGQGAGRDKLFELAVFRYLEGRYAEIFYTSAEGGCDMVVRDGEGIVSCVQACIDHEDIDAMQLKTEGLVWAMENTGAHRGVIVTPGFSDTMNMGDKEIEIIDADTFLSGEGPL